MPAAAYHPSSVGALLSGLVDDLLDAGTPIRLPVGGVSMAPRLRDGDHAIVVPVNGGDVRFGDLVLYRNADGALVLHRVVRRWRGREWLQTRGDDCIRLDTRIDASRVLGRVQRIERPGRVAVELESPVERLRAVVVAGAKLLRSAIHYKLGFL